MNIKYTKTLFDICKKGDQPQLKKVFQTGNLYVAATPIFAIYLTDKKQELSHEEMTYTFDDFNQLKSDTLCESDRNILKKLVAISEIESVGTSEFLINAQYLALADMLLKKMKVKNKKCQLKCGGQGKIEINHENENFKLKLKICLISK